jgi:signal transduction histidine kinase
MKKSVWIFLFAVLLPSVVLGWLALRSAEEQQIIFERRTAELYQKETDSLAVTVRDTVDAERRAFGETVHRLLAKGDAEALARDFTNTLTDAWEVKAVGFAINRDGKLVSPSAATASKQPEVQRFLLGNRGFLASNEPAVVYNWAGENNPIRGNKLDYGKGKSLASQSASNSYLANTTAATAGKDAAQITSTTAASNGTLNIGSQQKANGRALALVGAAQPTARAKEGESTFEFSRGMPAPNQQDNELTRRADVPAKSAALAVAPEKPSQIKQEPSTSPAAPLAEPAPASALKPPAPKPAASKPVNAPAIATATGRGRLSGLDDTLVSDAQKMPAPGSKSADKDSPTGGAEAKSKTRETVRGLAREDAAGTMKLAEPAAATGATKKTAEPVDELQLRIAPFEKAMAAKKETDDRKLGALAPSPQAPAAPQPIAPMPTDPMRDQPQAAQLALAPKPQSDATPRPAMRNEPQDFPIAQSQPAEPSPMPALAESKSDLAKAGRYGEEESGAQMTKSGAAALILNSAINRQVEPQQVLGAQGPAISTVVPEEAEFRSLTEEGDEGMIARFVQDKLNLIFWLRPPEAPEMVFGCLVEAGHFSTVWKDVMERHRASSRSGRAALESKPEFVLALLDDRGKPVATQPADAAARDWKHPFVASEIGEALPHWEAALYLASPTALAESARGLWRTLAFTIAGMVALIALGGWLVVADARRQLALAQQKTDFVSNVSHELKTPLTSIRMFAELMHDRPQPAEKQGQYLRIITVEAERLTRLINNVLDFAKIGRKQKRIEKKPLDLHEVIARVWESQELHLREDGFTTRWEAAPGPYPVLGDDDALAQVLVNLLSNAEKYSNGNKEVELHTWLDDGHVNVSVLDRGMGVPDGDERKIFGAFYRAHDSLASGIQGSGLGLTLAQRIAHEHGGEIKLEHREGGGCRFTLRLPLAGKVES